MAKTMRGLALFFLVAALHGASRDNEPMRAAAAEAGPVSTKQKRFSAMDGGEMTEPARDPFRAVRGGFVAIVVPDLDASATWYTEKLGLKVVKNHAMRPDKKAAVTILQANGLSVELIWFAEAAPLSKVAPHLGGNHEIHGILKAGIVVDDLDATLNELKSRGVTLAFEMFYDKAMDSRMFAIRDNNGNILQFFGK